MTTPGPDWVEQARRFAAGLAAEHAASRGWTEVLGGLLGAPDHTGTVDAGPECRWCPLCAGLAALRGRRPDLVEALADVLASAATALRSTTPGTTPDGSEAGTDVRTDPAPTESPAPPEENVQHPAPTRTVQRIDVA